MAIGDTDGAWEWFTITCRMFAGGVCRGDAVALVESPFQVTGCMKVEDVVFGRAMGDADEGAPVPVAVRGIMEFSFDGEDVPRVGQGHGVVPGFKVGHVTGYDPRCYDYEHGGRPWNACGTNLAVDEEAKTVTVLM